MKKKMLKKVYSVLKVHQEMRHLANQQWLNSTNVSKVVKNPGKKAFNLDIHPHHWWKINISNALLQWHEQLTVSKMAANKGIPTDLYFKIMTKNLGMWHLSTKFNNFSWVNKERKNWVTISTDSLQQAERDQNLIILITTGSERYV